MNKLQWFLSACVLSLLIAASASAGTIMADYVPPPPPPPPVVTTPNNVAPSEEPQSLFEAVLSYALDTLARLG